MYEVLVIGGGHAGCEAALAAARMGARTCMVTLRADTIGVMSCNPAIGGVAKGHLVREIDALGGEMGLAADATGIQFRRLNTRKGPAVRATRVQSDKARYAAYMQREVPARGVDVLVGEAVSVLTANGRVAGVLLADGSRVDALTVVITTGTFLTGVMHVGEQTAAGGRVNEPAARGLSDSLRSLGFELRRLKTGTPPRLDGRTIDYAGLEEQPSDLPLPRFSQRGEPPPLPQVKCHITYTTESVHETIRSNLHRSPLFQKRIVGVGPRYCPSLEDKVTRFADKPRHQIFLEPEGLDTVQVYPNGLSTSLPADVQLAFLRGIPGLERVEVLRYGYAVEYDFAPPTQLAPYLMTKELPGLFFAGQINGTSGYEEAASQGLMAGLNAVRWVRELEPVVLRRDQAYIGVLIDDLVTKGTDEPYRMLTSRAEFRLLLREDNAEERLAELGHDIGLLTDADHAKVLGRRAQGERLRQRLTAASVEGVRAIDWLKRPETSVAALAGTVELDDIEPTVQEQVEIAIRYEGYLRRQERDVERFQRLENVGLPASLDYARVPGLSREAREKLAQIRPQTLGQAARISGITPAAIGILSVQLRRLGGQGLLASEVDDV